MSLLQPLGLLALLAIPIIVLLHSLRAQRRTVPVSSLLHWLDTDVVAQARRRWRPPQLSLLLLLQILSAGLAAVALAQLAAERERGRHLVVVLDGSHTMRATDVSPNRFEAAREEALGLVAGLGPSDAATVILARRGPSGWATVLAEAAEPAVARAALSSSERVAPGAEPADLGLAVELGGAALRRVPAQTNEIVVLTGTGSEGLAARLGGTLQRQPAQTTLRAIGNNGANVGLVSFELRRVPGEAASRGFARVVNFSDHPVDAEVALTADGIPLGRTALALRPRSERTHTFTVPAGAVDVTAKLEQPAGAWTDALAADDRAVGAVGGFRRDVVLVAPDGHPLERALGVIPGVRFRQVRPADYRPDPPVSSSAPTPRLPVTLFVGWLPEQPPSGPALVVAPTTSSTWLPTGSSAVSGRLTTQDTQSPILRGVDLSSVSFGPVAPVAAPPWATTSANGADGPLIYEGLLNGQRLVVLAFDPATSNLPKLRAFPLLLANTLDWLAPAPVRSDIVAPEGDLQARSGATTVAGVTAPSAERLVDATWWRWLIVAALVVLVAEWWRYGHAAA